MATNLLGAIFWDIDPVLFSIGSFELRYYTLCFLGAFVISYIIMLKVFKREGKTQDELDQLSIYIFLGTLIGARMGHCLFYEFDYYKDHLLEMILPFRQTANGIELTGFHGLASHGGAVGILVAMALYCAKTKTNFLWLADRLVIVVAIAGACVRLGNFFNSEIVGLPSDLPWAVIFAKIDLVPRHPAQLYEALAYIVLFGILYNIYFKSKALRPGMLFGFFFIYLFGARFLIEFLKENQEAFEDAMSYNMGQLLSIPFVLVGIGLLFYSRKQPLRQLDSPRSKKKA